MTFFGISKETFSLEKLKENALLRSLFGKFEELPPDQKKIAAIGGAAVAIFFVFFLIYAGQTKVMALREEIEQKRENLKLLSKYELRFNEQLAALTDLERDAKQQSADFSLLSALESFATAAQIGRESIESLSPKQLPPGEFFIETEATVQLVRVTLRQLANYFYKIETSPWHLTIKEFKIKPRFDDPQFLNVTFKVTSFKPKE